MYGGCDLHVNSNVRDHLYLRLVDLGAVHIFFFPTINRIKGVFGDELRDFEILGVLFEFGLSFE